MNKAIFFDIDGTLLDGSRGRYEMSANTKIQIRRLQQDGDFVFLASGRPFAFLYEDLLTFGFDGFILMNGACIKLHDKAIYKQPLPKKYVDEVCRVCEKNNIEYILEGEKYVYLDKRFHHLDAFYHSFRMPRNYFSNAFSLHEITDEIFKIEFSPQNERQRAICKEFVTPDIDYMQDPRLIFLFELYSKQVSKATAILKILDYLKIDRQNSYAFGDGKNDIDMLMTVGHSFAMGNATAEIKAIASHVVAAAHEDGVAKGIEKYILANSSQG
jgi:Cof subfamily protein (haloacid dehalogenase superfamily)